MREISTSSLVEEYVDAAVVRILRRLFYDRLVIGVVPLTGH